MAISAIVRAFLPSRRPLSLLRHLSSSSTKKSNTSVNPGKFKFSEKDFESDESLWKLYERWMAHFNVYRDPAEARRRFDVFKGKAIGAHEVNTSNLSFNCTLYETADMTRSEFAKARLGREPSNPRFPGNRW